MSESLTVEDLDGSQALHQSQLEAQSAANIARARPRPAPTMAYFWKDYNPEARVLYIRNHEVANTELSKLGSGPQALGFDLEWKPNYVKGATENPVALVQLTNGDTIFLLQISAMREFPYKLAEVLANPLIVKAGVAIQSDAKKLYNDYQKNMYNCIDLSLLARTVDNDQWKGKYNSSLGLARLVEFYEYRLLTKDKITRSNWEANLTPGQVEYASNDANAGYILYRKLESLIPSLTSPPESIWYTFSYLWGYFVDAEGFQWQANNPNYDPGPPPPPRPPREPKNTDGADKPSEDKGEDAPVVAANAHNLRRKHDGNPPRGTFHARKRQPGRSTVAHHSPVERHNSLLTTARTPPVGTAVVGSSSHPQPLLPNGPDINHQNRQQRRQPRNIPQHLHSPPGFGPQHPSRHNYQPAQHNNMSRHPHIPPVQSNPEVRLHRPDGSPHRQPQSPPRNTHPPPLQTISPQLQVNTVPSTMPTGPPSQFSSPLGLTPYMVTSQPRSTSVHMNSIPPPPANRSRAARTGARRDHPNKRTDRP